MLQEYRIQKDVLSLEAFSVSDLSASLKKLFPTLGAGLLGVANKFVPDTPVVTLTGKQSDFVREVKKHAFLDLGPIYAYVPEGMSVRYLDYLHALEPAVQHVTNVMGVVVAPFTAFLAQLVSEDDAKFSTKELTQFRDLEKRREVVLKGLQRCFTSGSTQNESTFAKVVSRNADWEEVFSRASRLGDIMTGVDRKAMGKKLDEAVILTTKLIDKINRGQMKGVSPEVVKNLSEGVYEVAKEMEFFSATYYRVMSLNESLNRTVTHFKEVFKK